MKIYKYGMRKYINLVEGHVEAPLLNEAEYQPILVEGIETPIIPFPKRMDMMRMLASCVTVRGIVLYLKEMTMFAIADGSTWTHDAMVSAIYDSGIKLDWQYRQNSRAMYIFSIPAEVVLHENDWSGGGYYFTSAEGVGIVSSTDHLDARVEALFPHATPHGDLANVELTEAPISDISMHGNWEKNSSFKDQDRKLLNNPKAIIKIKSLWKYPDEVDYNIMLVNNAEANRHTEIGEIGDINAAATWLNEYMPKTAPELIANLKGSEVNIIYTNNKGDKRVPMTGWIMAHRFGHALFRNMFGKTMSHYYDESAQTLSRYIEDLAGQYRIRINGTGYGLHKFNALNATSTRNLISAICTFKSAREGNLRNSFEAVHELFAQYIINGRVIFNDIPTSVKVGNKYFHYSGGEDYDFDNRTISQDLAMELRDQFETACHYAVGKVYVM